MFYLKIEDFGDLKVYFLNLWPPRQLSWHDIVWRTNVSKTPSESGRNILLKIAGVGGRKLFPSHGSLLRLPVPHEQQRASEQQRAIVRKNSQMVR